MTKLREVFPNMFQAGDVGLEFEVESNKDLPVVRTGMWETTGDASLRGMVNNEYVTKHPLEYDKVAKAIKYIIDKVDQPEYDPIKDSNTTSWHVHINALNHTLTQMATATLLYWLLEPIIIRVCGVNRRSSPFCTQLYSAKDMIKVYDEDFFTRISSINPNDALHYENMMEHRRYGAQNMSAFAKFGSVEYRAMEGTFDKDRVIAWVETLKTIWSNNYKNPDEMLDCYYEKGAVAMVQGIVDVPVDNEALMMVDSNALLITSILDQVPMSWDKLEERMKKNNGVGKRKPPRIENNVINVINGAQAQIMVIDEVAPNPPDMWVQAAPIAQRGW